MDEQHRKACNSCCPHHVGQPFTISSATALGAIGLSWAWCLRFARQHGVEVLRVSERKQLIVYQSLVDAMRRHSAALERAAPALTEEQMTDQMLRELGFVPVKRL